MDINSTRPGTQNWTCPLTTSNALVLLTKEVVPTPGTFSMGKTERRAMVGICILYTFPLATNGVGATTIAMYIHAANRRADTGVRRAAVSCIANEVVLTSGAFFVG
ncbi:MAG: hypothetical protein EP343_12520 [Deltaproteobacteria bacterium]|nr:MAG: hypothetical protein EP343_12520 [Deltaproteobacteria bacterium]